MEEFFDKLLRYGMFLGAIFQLVCIAAVIILPEQMKNHRENGQFEITDSESDSNTQTNRRSHIYHRVRKQDKKKRR
ncbi:hypothetical protein PGB90_001451 [Kerria lacca]